VDLPGRERDTTRPKGKEGGRRKEEGGGTAAGKRQQEQQQQQQQQEEKVKEEEKEKEEEEEEEEEEKEEKAGTKPLSSSSFFLNSHTWAIMLAAVQSGDAEELAELMKQDPGFDVNMDQNGEGCTLLHYACLDSSSSPVIPLLLAHPDIDVNVKDEYGYTPFYWACDGSTSCIREMLKDSRVKVNEPNNSGQTPLWWAVYGGNLEIIKWWIVSGREMDLGKPGDVDKTDAIGVAKKNGYSDVVALLERFKENPGLTRHAMRLKIGWYDEAAAKVFAMVVFVSDGLLQINATTTPAARFFTIARRFPLELQMVLCYRVLGSCKEIIPGKDSELAFKELAKRLTWSSIFTR